MAELVESAMGAGCFGLSSGLEYRPGWFADRAELSGIGRPVARNGGLVMSHIRNEDDDAIRGALDELLTQGRDSGCAVHVAHIKVVHGSGAARAEEILRQLAGARRQGVSVTADIYPYLASYTGISIVFPDWALPPHDYEQVATARRDDLAEYLRQRVSKRNGPEATLLGTGPWTGKTLAEVARELDKPFEDVLIDDLGPGGTSAAYFTMEAGLQERLLIDPSIMISTDGSPTMRHPRGYGAFAKVIREYVVEKGLLNLETAVWKMTGLTAVTIGLEEMGRGMLKEGYAADILIFDPGRIRDNATFEEPHRLATGYSQIIVNGLVARENGRATGERGGRMLRRR